MARPVRMLPNASRVVAVSVPVRSFGRSRRFNVDGVTVTVATGASATVIADAPPLPPAAQGLAATPGNRPVTTPVCVTAAVSGLSLDHATAALLITALFTSRTVAASVVVNATLNDAVSGVTVTLPT